MKKEQCTVCAGEIDNHSIYCLLYTTEQEIWDFVKERFGERTMSDITIKLSEECGEIAGEVTRLNLKLKEETDSLEKELGDILIVLSQFAAIRGTTLKELRQKRFEQIKNRVWKPEN